MVFEFLGFNLRLRCEGWNVRWRSCVGVRGEWLRGFVVWRRSELDVLYIVSVILKS